MLRSIAAECECSCSHSRSALRCVSKHEGAHIGSSSSFETRARPFVLCGFSSACALLRMRTASRFRPTHDVKQPISFPRRVFAPGLCNFASLTRIEGWAERRETCGCLRGTRGARHLASKTRVNALMTRHARRLRGALRPITQDARLSALHRGFALPLIPAHSASKTRVNALLLGIQGLGPAFAGTSGRRLTPRHATPRHATPRHATLRIQDRL
jgi:hypothetical protein